MTINSQRVRHGEAGSLHDFDPLGCKGCADWRAFFRKAQALGFAVEDSGSGELVVYTGLRRAPTGLSGYIDTHRFIRVDGQDEDECRICGLPEDFEGHGPVTGAVMGVMGDAT